MRRITIYLAGAMMNCESFAEMNSWRVEIGNALRNAAQYRENCELRIVNPCDYYNFENPRHQNQKEVMQFDLARVKESDILIVNLDGLNESIGSCIEVYEAWKKDIPIIAIDWGQEFSQIHSWMKCCIARVETFTEDLVEYISDFYFR